MCLLPMFMRYTATLHRIHWLSLISCKKQACYSEYVVFLKLKIFQGSSNPPVPFIGEQLIIIAI